jgi:membrane protease YdiL (CAAX protease family)
MRALNLIEAITATTSCCTFHRSRCHSAWRLSTICNANPRSDKISEQARRTLNSDEAFENEFDAPSPYIEQQIRQRMCEFFKSLSARAEAWIVLSISFGLWLIQSIRVLILYLTSDRTPPDPWITNETIVFLVGYQLVILLVVSLIGHLRGWSFSTFGLQISWKLTGIGILLAATACSVLAILPVGILGNFRGHITWPFLIVALIVNPFFEEALEVGYVFHAFRRYGMWIAVVASASLRAIFHLYLGPAGFVAVLAFGLLAGAVYWKWRQLWPLFVAHSLCDLMVLFPLVQ